MSLRKTDLRARYSAFAAAGLWYSSFAMSTVLLRTYPSPQRNSMGLRRAFRGAKRRNMPTIVSGENVRRLEASARLSECVSTRDPSG